LCQRTINIKTTVIWMLVYLIICGIIPALLDQMLWKTINNDLSAWLNLFTLTALNSIFIFVLKTRYRLKVSIFQNVSLSGILLAFGSVILFYLLLDNLLDPFFDRVFVTSAEEYKRAIAQLKQFPVVNFIRVCLLAPVVEEILIRGYILNSLQDQYGITNALLLSSLFFAVLHFNLVQTLSALICGLVLGLLYIKTGSLASCILSHSLYNTISYLAILG
jgi:membrane protease YdiL (CAAX protease family)